MKCYACACLLVILLKSLAVIMYCLWSDLWNGKLLTFQTALLNSQIFIHVFIFVVSDNTVTVI